MSISRLSSLALLLLVSPLCAASAADGPLREFKLEWRTVKKQVALIGWEEFDPPAEREPHFYKDGVFDGQIAYLVILGGGVGDGDRFIFEAGRKVMRAIPDETAADGFAVLPAYESRGGGLAVRSSLEAYQNWVLGLNVSYSLGRPTLVPPYQYHSAAPVSHVETSYNTEGWILEPYSDHYYSYYTNANFSFTFSSPDTESDAEGRADVVELAPNPSEPPVVAPDSGFIGASFREKRTGRAYVRYASEFNLRLKLCPGKYVLRWRVSKSLRHPDGTEDEPTHEPQERPITIDERTELDSNGYYDLKWIDVAQRLEPDHMYRIANYKDGVNYRFFLEPKDTCQKCASVGSGGVGFGSVKAWFDLGKDASGASAGFLSLHAEDIGADTHLPSALRAVRGDSATTRFEYDATGALRQAQTDRRIIDIVPLPDPAEGYRLDFYRAADATGWEDGRFRTFGTATPELSWTVRRLADSGGHKHLRITRSEGGADFVHLFSQNIATPSAWTYSDTNGLRVTTRSETPAPGGDTYRTTTLSDAAYGIASVKRERLRAFPWGEEVVEETLDPDGAHPLTTTHDYHTSGVGQGHLWKTTAPDGTITENTFAAYDTGLNIITSRLSSTTTTHPNGRVQTTTRGTLADLTGDDVDAPHSLVTTTETLGGQLLRRTWQIGHAAPEDLDGDGVLYTTTRHIRAAATSAAWDDPRNEVTLTRAATAPTGRLNISIAPDGTLTRTRHGLPDAAGIREITTDTGPADATGTGLLAGAGGTRTVRELDALGRTLAQTTTDLASGLVIAFEQVTAWSESNPELPTHITHLDGSEEVRAYSPCCGKLESVTRHGRATTYAYDALGRQTTVTRDGITTETRYDAADRVRETLLYPAGTPTAAKLVSASTYDPAGRLTATTTPHAIGQTVTTTHAETIDSVTGQTTTLTTYPADPAAGLPAGLVTEIRASDGSPLRLTGNAASAALAYAYAAVSLPDAATWGYSSADRFLATTETRLDAAGDPTAETLTTYTDALGRTIKTLHPDGAAARRFHDSAGRLAKTVDPDGLTTLHAHETGAFGEKTTLAIDLAATTGGARNGTIDLAGGHDRVTHTTTSYAQRDGATVRRTTTEIWENSTAATETSVTDVSIDGLRSWHTLRGAQTTATLVEIDSSGLRTETTTHPDATTTVRTIEAGRLASETRKDSAGAVLSETTYQYDNYGRLSARTQTGLGTSTYTWFDDGQLETVTTPDPGTGAQTTGYTYNKRGWVATVTHPDSALTHTTYYPAGQVKRSWGVRSYPSEYTYDAQGRVKTLTTWQDFAGQSGAATAIWNYHPQRGWLENKRYQDDKGPSYTYTPAGRLHTRTWARTVGGSPLVTTYDYTDAGDLESITYSDTTPAVSHTYDRAGRLHTTTDAAGLITRARDPATAILASETYTGAPGSAGLLSGRAIARTYDALHRPQSLATDGGHALAYTYDPAGRLDTVVQGFHLAKYAYAANLGTVESVTIKRLNVERVRHTRTTDALGRTTRVQSASNDGATIHVRRDYTYNAANQRTDVEIEDTRRWAYGYDDLGQVTSAQKRLADNATPLPGYSFGYAFDDIGNRTGTSTNGRAATYAPNLLNRYASRQVPGAFDVRGEADPAATVTVEGLATTRIGRDFYREITAANTGSAVSTTLAIVATLGGDTVTQDRPAFLPQTPEDFAHDDDGNLTQDGRWDYVWDAENRLIAMETRVAIAAAFPELKKRLTFAYDAQGRRIAKRVFDWSSSTSSFVLILETKFLYDGWNLLTELDALNGHALVRSHVWGLDLSGSMQGAGGVGGLLWSNTPTHTFAPSADANGNIVAWINTATLAVAGRADYGPFGERVQATGVAATLPFGFSTKYTDAETGLLYYGYRYLDTSTGRWPNRDPIKERGGLNLYEFVRNHATGAYDVLGMAPGDVYATLAAAEAAAAQDVFNATKESVRRGRAEEESSPGEPDFRGKDYAIYHSPRLGEYIWIYGVEYGTIVYSYSDSAGIRYSYASLIRGTLPDGAAARFKGTLGSVAFSSVKVPHENHRNKICKNESGVHSHNVESIPYAGLGDEFSEADKQWAAGQRIPIILVDRNGKSHKHSP